MNARLIIIRGGQDHCDQKWVHEHGPTERYGQSNQRKPRAHNKREMVKRCHGYR